MSVTREELYEAVWAAPTRKAAAKYAVSGSFLARVCESLNVPRPPRGYWAKLKFGKASPKPPLPQPKPGDALEWRRDWMPVARVPPAPPTPPTTGDAPRRRVPVPERHPLLWQVQPLFEKARPAHSYSDAADYLRPYKRALPDIFVTKEQLPRALDLANDLYRALTSHGHHVVLAPDDGHHYTRPFLAYDGKKRNAWESSPWAPSVPTLAFVGSVAIGLTVFEPAEEAEGRHVDGKFVRASELPTPRRPRAYEWTSKHMFPSRRLAVRAYSPYRGTSWEKTWAEPSPGRLGTSIKRIRGELVEAAPRISEMAIDAERLRQQEQARLEAEHQRWRVEEARRLHSEAVKASRAELLSAVEGWSLARRVEQFFEDVERRADSLPSDEKSALAERVANARELLGGVDALHRLRTWRPPGERLSTDAIEPPHGRNGGTHKRRHIRPSRRDSKPKPGQTLTGRRDTQITSKP